MITYKTGNLFDDDAQCLVNAVNAAGVMGAGIAKEFKRRYPQYFSEYVALCKHGYLSRAGDVAITHITPSMQSYLLKRQDAIISAATKTHWRDQSTLADIEKVLQRIARFAVSYHDKAFDTYGLKSIAMPALGCGLGGLSWSDVQPLIERVLGDVDCDIRVYLPKEMK